MKKLLLATLSILLCTSVAFAEEAQTALQETDIDMAGFVAVINKQPENNVMTQKVTIKRSGFALIVNVNGKVEIPQKEEKEAK